MPQIEFGIECLTEAENMTRQKVMLWKRKLDVAKARNNTEKLTIYHP